jgi:DNA-binding transcriptional ArsR family regulator
MIPGPSTITLDQESFKALASEVRVGILKKLDERRQTVTDLSALLGLSKPTLLEHLERLQMAGLVKRVEEGRKWIYYELSQKGRKLLHPEKVAIVLALASATVLAAVGIFLLVFATPEAANLGSHAPLAQQHGVALNAGPGIASFAVFAFAAAAVAVAFGLFLRWYGSRRRQRFFPEIAKT